VVRGLARGRRLIGYGVSVLAFGLYAVTPVGLYAPDTWPDYTVIAVASVLTVAGTASLLLSRRRGWRALFLGSLVLVGVCILGSVVAKGVVDRSIDTWRGVAGSAQGFLAVSLGCWVLAALVGLVGATVEQIRHRGRSRRGVQIPLAELPWESAVLGGEPAITVDGPDLVLQLPRLLRDGELRIPASAVAVVGPLPPLSARLEASDADADDDWDDDWKDDWDDDADARGWVAARPVVLPYLASGPAILPPNLTLVLRTPRRMPQLRWLAHGKVTDVSVRDSRSLAGVLVDGLRLRAVDPSGAVWALALAGVPIVDDEDAFIEQHRELTTDPRVIQRRQALETAETAWQLGGSALFVIGMAVWTVTRSYPWVILAGVGALSARLVPRWHSRRARRDEPPAPPVSPPG